MPRLNENDYFMGVADVVSRRSTCSRRNVGCVVINNHNHIMATGHNGVPRGVTHCVDSPCGGIYHASGLGLDECMAVHAEANALMQCKDIMVVKKIYCTTFPCIQCIKMIMNTSCAELIYRDDYSHGLPTFLTQSITFKIRKYTP